MKRFLLTAIAMMLLPLSASGAPHSDYDRLVYVPPATAGVEVPCGSGAQIASLYYFPSAGETRYTLHALASGGHSGGQLILSLPLGYEESTWVPPYTPGLPYTVTVTTPPYTGDMPVLIQVRADGGACSIAPFTPKGPSSMVVRAINIHAGSPSAR